MLLITINLSMYIKSIELIFNMNYDLGHTRKMMDAFNKEGKTLGVGQIVTPIRIKVFMCIL